MLKLSFSSFMLEGIDLHENNSNILNLNSKTTFGTPTIRRELSFVRLTVKKIKINLQFYGSLWESTSSALKWQYYVLSNHMVHNLVTIFNCYNNVVYQTWHKKNLRSQFDAFILDCLFKKHLLLLTLRLQGVIRTMPFHYASKRS